MLLSKTIKKTIGEIAIIILLSLPSIISLLQPGFFQTDDGNWMVIRFAAFADALRDGQFPVRFLTQLNHGYGYPVANFLYPGFMYLGIPLKLLGFSFVSVIKILFGITMIASSLGMYLWLRTKYTVISSLVGALVYLYLPYHLFDMTVRGSLGELLALAIVPFVMWALERKKYITSSLLTALLILSHNTLAVLFVPLLYIVAIYFDKKSYKSYLFSLASGTAVAAFFWLPALLELPYTIFSQTHISDTTNYFASPLLMGIGSLLVLLAGGANIVQGNGNKKIFPFFLLFCMVRIFFPHRYYTKKH